VLHLCAAGSCSSSSCRWPCSPTLGASYRSESQLAYGSLNAVRMETITSLQRCRCTHMLAHLKQSPAPRPHLSMLALGVTHQSMSCAGSSRCPSRPMSRYALPQTGDACSASLAWSAAPCRLPMHVSCCVTGGSLKALLTHEGWTLLLWCCCRSPASSLAPATS